MYLRLFISTEINKISFFTDSKGQPSGSNPERRKLFMFGKKYVVLNSAGEKFSPHSLHYLQQNPIEAKFLWGTVNSNPEMGKIMKASLNTEKH
jgi:hypothetical protein